MTQCRHQSPVETLLFPVRMSVFGTTNRHLPSSRTSGIRCYQLRTASLGCSAVERIQPRAAEKTLGVQLSIDTPNRQPIRNFSMTSQERTHGGVESPHYALSPVSRTSGAIGDAGTLWIESKPRTRPTTRASRWLFGDQIVKVVS